MTPPMTAMSDTDTARGLIDSAAPRCTITVRHRGRLLPIHQTVACAERATHIAFVACGCSSDSHVLLCTGHATRLRELIVDKICAACCVEPRIDRIEPI